MLVAQVQATNVRVSAWQTTREDGPFVCPACSEPVVLHKGTIRTHHFAHKAKSDCKHGVGETEIHRRAKMGLFLALSKYPNLQCGIEVPLQGVRSDVWFQSISTKRTYAIEVQVSQLTMAEIIERTKRYASQGVYVLWLFEWKSELRLKQYSPSLKERWAHALNFGWVYYWSEGETVIPVKFDKVLLYRSESSWYDSDGSEQGAGGNWYTSKRYRKPLIGDLLTIARDFRGVERKAWKGGDIEIPACRILTAKSTL